jgi:transposase-like protein
MPEVSRQMPIIHCPHCGHFTYALPTKPNQHHPQYWCTHCMKMLPASAIKQAKVIGGKTP